MRSDVDREEALFGAVAQLEGVERAAFLNSACQSDPVLRQRLDARLQAQEQASGPQTQPEFIATVVGASKPAEEAGLLIGRYKLLEKLGEGGFGAVWLAEQKEPVRRKVALKIIKLGMDTKQVVARFEAERQALAMMDHPNIAKVLDAGTTDTGRPYFVMELVRGIPITQFCDEQQMPTQHRLELLINVCQAVQHAHQKGIIHRDLKPSNILVTLHDGVPVPKVIDFGIAKATQQELTDKTIHTQFQQFIGTPAYMSPEQAEMSGLDVDTRTDIYSLGVLLYELLVGRTPFDAKELMASGIDAMRKTIREREPARPSTKLATLLGDDLTTTAKRRSADTSKLLHQLKGDLDWIVMKCLEKDRTRRYDTANGLAMDLKRHLHNEPVVARPPTAAYKFQKAFRRNKLIFTAATAVAGALLLGVIGSTWQALRATQARRAETVAREKAVQAQANELRLRQQAQSQELTARQRAYASDMNVASEALAGSNLGRALDLLNRQRPLPGQKDLRGWEWRYLWQQTRSEALFTLHPETAEINTLAVSSDGSWLAVGTNHRGGLSLWDLRSRQELFRLATNDVYFHAAFSPTDPLLAFTSSSFESSGLTRNTLRFWNTLTHQITIEILLDSKAEGLAFAKDGQTLVISSSSGRAGQISVWQMPQGSRRASYSTQQYSLDPATDFAATADLSLAAYGAPSGELHVLDLRNGQELWSAPAAKHYVTALAFSPDGRTLASGAGFGESDIRLWEARTGREIGRLEGHKSWVSSLVFWPDGKKLASSSADQTIRTWELTAGRSIDVFRGHLLEVWRLALLPDNKTLVSGGKDGSVGVWDTSLVRPGREKVTWPEKIWSWTFTPDGSILTHSQDGAVTLCSGPDFQRKELITNTTSGFVGDCFSRDACLLALGSTNGQIIVWQLSQPPTRREFKTGEGSQVPLRFLAQGSRLIIQSSDQNLLKEWDLEAGREIQAWSAPPNFDGLGMSPDERFVLAVGWEGDVLRRDFQTHSTTPLSINALEGWGFAFSADGRHLALASALGYARVWDTVTWREEATLRGFLNAVGSVAFSPDGKRLATGGSNEDDTLKLWDVETWQEVLSLRGLGNQSYFTAFSPDGNAVGTRNSQGFLQIWHAPSFQEIATAEAKDKTESQQP